MIRKPILKTLLPLVGLLFACCSLPAADFTYTEAQAQTWARELLPMVEEQAGAKFKTPPPIKIGTGQGLLPILSHFLLSQVYVLYPELTNEQVREAEKQASTTSAQRILGDFDVESKAIMFFPNNMAVRMGFAGVDPKYYEQITKIVIAHEMTHALQDQVAGLGGLSAASYVPQLTFPDRAVIEGQAAFVMGRVGGKIGATDATAEFFRSLSAGWRKSSDPAMEAVLVPMRRLFSYSYLDGRNFVNWQEQKGGSQAVWKVLRNPPARMSMIFKPETYSPTAPHVSYDLKGLDEMLTDRRTVVRSFEIDEAVLRAIMEPLGEKDRDLVVSSIKATGSILSASRHERASVTIFGLKSPAASAAVMSALDTLDRNTIAALEESPSAKITAKTSGPIAAMKSDKTTKVTFTSTTGAESTPITIVRAARGAVIVQISLVGEKLSDRATAAVIEEAFRRAATPK